MWQWRYVKTLKSTARFLWLTGRRSYKAHANLLPNICKTTSCLHGNVGSLLLMTTIVISYAFYYYFNGCSFLQKKYSWADTNYKNIMPQGGVGVGKALVIKIFCTLCVLRSHHLHNLVSNADGQLLHLHKQPGPIYFNVKRKRAKCTPVNICLNT